MALNFWEVRHGPSEFPPLRLSICLSQSPPNKYMYIYIYMYVYMLYIYIYIYIYICYISISLSLSIYIYIYIPLFDTRVSSRGSRSIAIPLRSSSDSQFGDAQIHCSMPRFSFDLCPIHSIYALNSFDLYPIPSIHSIYAQILSSGTIITVIIIHY